MRKIQRQEPIPPQMVAGAFQDLFSLFPVEIRKGIAWHQDQGETPLQAKIAQICFNELGKKIKLSGFCSRPLEHPGVVINACDIIPTRCKFQQDSPGAAAQFEDRTRMKMRQAAPEGDVFQAVGCVCFIQAREWIVHMSAPGLDFDATKSWDAWRWAGAAHNRMKD